MPSTPEKRRIIRVLDSRFVVPKDCDPIKILLVTQAPNNDGGTGWHYEYHVLCEEVDE